MNRVRQGESVSFQDFRDALKSVLLRPIRKKSRWENREPTRKELSERFRLKRK